MLTDDPDRNSSNRPGQSHLHFHRAQRPVALPKQVFLPPISKDKRGSVRQSEPTARIQAIGYTGDRLIGVHPCLSAAKNPCSGQSITSGRRVGISNAIALGTAARTLTYFLR
jgi:hypothetical protein